MASVIFHLPRSLQRGSAKYSVPVIFSKTFCSEVVQSETTVDEVIISGRKYTNKKIDVADLQTEKLVSRLPTKYRNRMKHVNIPDPQETHPDEYRSLFRRHAYNKMLYMSYGKKSGLDPGILWPSEQELKDIKEYEEEWEPSIQSLWESLKKEKDELKGKMDAREQLITERMKLMPQFIEGYRKKLHKVKEMEQVSLKEKNKFLDMAREKFGYKIDPSHPKVIEFKLQLDSDEKDKTKAKKKAEQTMKKLEWENAQKAKLKSK